MACADGRPPWGAEFPLRTIKRRRQHQNKEDPVSNYRYLPSWEAGWGGVTPGIPAELRGELGFAASLGYWEIGAGTIRPPERRQYTDGATIIDNEMELCLKWRAGFPQGIPPIIAP